MTSSLVGSEMCIRDSLSPEGLIGRVKSTCKVPNVAALSPPKWCLTTGPVSYTHLTLPTICSV
eukprot:1597454-Prorocentrum_lima.AAC.1